jgi:hypothetical protein
MENKKLTSTLIVFLFILLCDGNVLTFNDGRLTPQQIVTYSDGSVVIRLVERLNDTCNVPNLTYKILYPNGTESNLVTVYDYDHQIPSFNFCSKLHQIQVIDTITNYILVLYSNGILKSGMMIDWSGKITR